jgi:hypothetical protein
MKKERRSRRAKMRDKHEAFLDATMTSATQESGRLTPSRACSGSCSTPLLAKTVKLRGFFNYLISYFYLITHQYNLTYASETRHDHGFRTKL